MRLKEQNKQSSSLSSFADGARLPTDLIRRVAFNGNNINIVTSAVVASSLLSCRPNRRHVHARARSIQRTTVGDARRRYCFRDVAKLPYTDCKRLMLNRVSVYRVLVWWPRAPRSPDWLVGASVQTAGVVAVPNRIRQMTAPHDRLTAQFPVNTSCPLMSLAVRFTVFYPHPPRSVLDTRPSVRICNVLAPRLFFSRRRSWHKWLRLL